MGYIKFNLIIYALSAYIKFMKQIAAVTIAACLALSPLAAEEKNPGEVEQGLSLLEQGSRLFMRGLITEMGPALDGLKGMAGEVAPMFEELQEMIGDFTNFHLPEVLPNGDIIIRRKAPLTVVPLAEGEIEL